MGQSFKNQIQLTKAFTKLSENLAYDFLEISG